MPLHNTGLELKLMQHTVDRWGHVYTAYIVQGTSATNASSTKRWAETILRRNKTMCYDNKNKD